MEKNQYQDILRQAFLITWKNKFLWIFGFFIFLGSAISNVDVHNEKISQQMEKTAQVATFIQQHPVAFLGLTSLLIFIAIVFFLLKILATSAIIKSASNIELYRQLSLGAILTEARPSLWRLFLLEFLISISLGIIIAMLSLPIIYLFMLKAKIFAFLLLISAVLIIIPLLVLAYYLRKYAYFYIVLGDFKIKIALEMAYAIFIKNVKTSIVMGLITLILGLLALITIPFILFATLVIIFPLGLVAYLTSAKIAIIITIVLGIIFTLGTILIFFSWFASFLQTVWLLFFQQISFEKTNEKKIAEKEAIEGKIPNPEII